MLEISDFKAKQIIVSFCNDGDKIKIQNDNILIIDKDGEIKCQCTCYRLFSIFVVGNTTLTSVLIERAKKFGFTIVLFTSSFRVYEVIGFRRDANFLLHRKQYEYDSLDIAKHLIRNKISNQLTLLSRQRKKEFDYRNISQKFHEHAAMVDGAKTVQEIMGYEGMASKTFFLHHFKEYDWHGRRPRVKNDYINSILDIGYTVLFAFIESMLSIYGFDVYCGVLHTMFYMRKSLVCDVMEPFRAIVDEQVKKSLNLGQFKESDFKFINRRFELEWEKSKKYVAIILNAILNYKEDIFKYFRQYYRAVMKGKAVSDFPVFEV